MSKTLNNRRKIQFKDSSLNIIDNANEIIAEYSGGLTLRQLFYQFVSRMLLPNTIQAYKRLGKIAGNARLAGLIVWDSIIDRTRRIHSNGHFEGPSDILFAAANSYKLNSRADQEVYLEVWIEKEALIGVIEPICRKLDVLYLACRGYFSLSAMWLAAERFNEAEADGKETVVLHLGDHDPSGLDMSQDIQNRLWGFDVQTEVKRIALNMDQIDLYNPPPNFAKLTDSRAKEYIPKYGNKSWELDALEPNVITALIEDAIDEYTDQSKREIRLEEQKFHKQKLAYISKHWTEL